MLIFLLLFFAFLVHFLPLFIIASYNLPKSLLWFSLKFWCSTVRRKNRSCPSEKTGYCYCQKNVNPSTDILESNSDAVIGGLNSGSSKSVALKMNHSCTQVMIPIRVLVEWDCDACCREYKIILCCEEVASAFVQHLGRLAPAVVSNRCSHWYAEPRVWSEMQQRRNQGCWETENVTMGTWALTEKCPQVSSTKLRHEAKKSCFFVLGVSKNTIFLWLAYTDISSST